MQLHHFDSSDDIVRSVHLSADASRLALGSDRQGRGVARLYDANSNELLAHLPHDKPVWCVRLSNNGALLAVAGYDCKLTVYDCSSRPEDRNFCAPLQSIKYESTGGPAFIWSCAFSADNRMLALGTWDASRTSASHAQSHTTHAPPLLSLQAAGTSRRTCTGCSTSSTRGRSGTWPSSER